MCLSIWAKHACQALCPSGMGRPGVGQGRLGQSLAAHWHPRRPGDPHRCHTLDMCPAASQPALFPCSLGGSSRIGGEPAAFLLADTWPGAAPESPCHCQNYSLGEAVGLPVTLGSAPGRRGSAPDVVPSVGSAKRGPPSSAKVGRSGKAELASGLAPAVPSTCRAASLPQES